jgi:hypothetical protein
MTQDEKNTKPDLDLLLAMVQSEDTASPEVVLMISNIRKLLPEYLATQKKQLVEAHKKALIKYDLVEKVPGRCGGNWTFKNTRIQPKDVFNLAKDLINSLESESND